MSSSTEPKGLATDPDSTGTVPWNQQSDVSDIMCLRRSSLIDYTTLDSENTRKNANCHNPSHQILHINKEAQQKLDPVLIDLLDGQRVKYHFDRVATSHEEGSLLKDCSRSYDVLLTLPRSYDKQELPWFSQPPGGRPSTCHPVAPTYLVQRADSTHIVRAITDRKAEADGYQKWAIIDAPRHTEPKPFSMKLTSRVLNGEASSQTSFEIVQPSVEYLDSMFSTLAIGKHVSPEARKIYEATKKRLTTEDETVPDRSKVISWWLGPLVKDEHGRPLYCHDRDTGVTTQIRKITYYILYNEAEHHDEAYPETESEKTENSTQS